MRITAMTILKLNKETRLVGSASIVLDDMFVVNFIKILKVDGGFMLGMPSVSKKSGGFQDVAHPINPETRNALEHLVFDAYHFCEVNNYDGAQFLLESNSHEDLLGQDFSRFVVKEHWKLEDGQAKKEKKNYSVKKKNADFYDWLNS